MTYITDEGGEHHLDLPNETRAVTEVYVDQDSNSMAVLLLSLEHGQAILIVNDGHSEIVGIPTDTRTTSLYIAKGQTIVVGNDDDSVLIYSADKHQWNTVDLPH